MIFVMARRNFCNVIVGAGALDSPLSQGLRIILHFENNAKLQYPISPHGNNLYRRIVAVNVLLIFSQK